MLTTAQFETVYRPVWFPEYAGLRFVKQLYKLFYML
jgi:hypothetical protein